MLGIDRKAVSVNTYNTGPSGQVGADRQHAGQNGLGVRAARPSEGERSEATGISPAAPNQSQLAVNCISSLKLDGGTAFEIETKAQQWSDKLKALIRHFQYPSSLSTDRRGVILEMGPDDGNVRKVKITISGSLRHRIKLSYADEADIDINASTGKIVVETRAHSLWCNGLKRWMATWLDFVSRLANEQGCSPETAHLVGWKTRNIELCSDFVGLKLLRSDGGNFTTKSKVRTIEKTNEDRLDIVGNYGHEIETIQIGDRKSRCSMSIHQKSKQIRTVKKIDPAVSIYAPTWRSSRYYDPDQDITRVELRLNNRSLKFRNRECPNVVVDLSIPKNLLNTSMLAAVWAYETNRRRLCVPNSATRGRRCKTDPRWEEVQRASGLTEVPTLSQDRDVSHLAKSERLAKVDKQLVKDAIEATVLTGTETDLDSVLTTVYERITQVFKSADFDLEDIASRTKLKYQGICLGDQNQPLGFSRVVPSFLARSSHKAENSLEPLSVVIANELT